jgi:hypothetical protein
MAKRGHRISTGKKWTAEEKAFVYAEYEKGHNDGVIGDALGRTIASIASFRKQEGLVGTNPKSSNWEEVVSREWGKRYPEEIGALVGITGERVSQIARRLSLGSHGLPSRNPYTPPPGHAPKPRGYTPALLRWARRYRGDRQADLIASHRTGKRVGLGYGPRV